MLSIALLVALFSANLAAKIGVIVNKDLYPSIKTSVDQYVADLKSVQGKDVWLEKDNFTEVNTVAQLKDALKSHFQTDNLEGAVLIGDLPIPIYNLDNDKFSCDHYYQDMNGTWTGSGNTFTNHTGDTKGEIWISRITASVLENYGGFGNEIDIVNKYFGRVAKRMGGHDTQERTYVIAGMYWEWKGLEAENIGDLDYDSAKIDKYRSTADNSTSNNECGKKWLAAIVSGREYGYIYSHSSPTSHSVGVSIKTQRDSAINCRFYNSYACSNGDYEQANMVGAYALSDQGLVCVGSSKTGSMIPGSFRYYNRPLGAGKSFGESFLQWYNDKGINDKYWHYGMNLQGVGTLHLKPYSSTPYLSLSTPNGGESWERGKKYDIKWSSNVGGDVKIELLKAGALKETITSSAANNGLYAWTLPLVGETGTDYKIRIQSLLNSSVIAVSQADFKIVSSTGVLDQNQIQGVFDVRYRGSRIHFQIPDKAKNRMVLIQLFSVQGKCVRTQVNGAMSAGQHSIDLVSDVKNGSSVASGIYICRMACGDFTKDITVALRR